MNDKCYIVCGATFPYSPTLWTSKHMAMKAAAKLRRTLRSTYSHWPASRNWFISVEPRSLRDMSGRMKFSNISDVYNYE